MGEAVLLKHRHFGRRQREPLSATESKHQLVQLPYISDAPRVQQDMVMVTLPHPGYGRSRGVPRQKQLNEVVQVSSPKKAWH